MEEFIKQKRNEGFSEKVAREFYIDMKEERNRQDRINERERDRQMQIEREEREHQYKMLELQARMTVDSNRNEEINLPSRTEKMLMPNFSEEKDNIDAYLERFERIAEIK